jgi:hypothetical protein
MLKKNKTAKADLFCEGWLAGVYQQVIDLVPEEKEQALIDAFVALHHPKLADGDFRDVKKASKHQSAKDEGYQIGATVRIHAAVAGHEQQQLELIN